MDRVADAGVGWRKKTREMNAHRGIVWLDPTRKPIDIGTEDDASRARRRRAKASGKLGVVVAEMKPIRCVDLRMVDVSDFIVVNLDMDIHACGTYEEIFLANRQKKPILIHVEQGRNAVPDWLLATVPAEHIFDNWESLWGYMHVVDCGPHWRDTHGRWYFFDWTGHNAVTDNTPIHLYSHETTSPVRSLVKAATWETFSFFLTLGISYGVTQDFNEASELTIALFILKVLFLFLYERAWHKVRWGKS
jgi:uncharacterized membrane protein